MVAVKYEVPANIVLAVKEKEGGKAGQWVRSSNDTYDVGAMQFNPAYLPDLAQFGITAAMSSKPGTMRMIWARGGSGHTSKTTRAIFGRKLPTTTLYE